MTSWLSLTGKAGPGRADLRVRPYEFSERTVNRDSRSNPVELNLLQDLLSKSFLNYNHCGGVVSGSNIASIIHHTSHHIHSERFEDLRLANQIIQMYVPCRAIFSI